MEFLRPTTYVYLRLKPVSAPKVGSASPPTNAMSAADDLLQAPLMGSG